LHVKVCDIDRTASIEETRSVPKLEQTCLTHCLLNDDVQNLTHGLTVLSIWIVDVLSVDGVLSNMINLELNFATH
jgi:hypothetical protein